MICNLEYYALKRKKITSRKYSKHTLFVFCVPPFLQQTAPLCFPINGVNMKETVPSGIDSKQV